MFCSYSYAFGDTSQKVTHPKIVSSQTLLTIVKFSWNGLPKLTMKFLRNGLTKTRCILLVYVVANNSYNLPSTTCLPGLRISPITTKLNLPCASAHPHQSRALQAKNMLWTNGFKQKVGAKF